MARYKPTGSDGLLARDGVWSNDVMVERPLATPPRGMGQVNIFTRNGTSISTYILDQPAAAHVGHRRSGYFPAPHRRRVGAAERIQEADALIEMALEDP